MCVKTYEVITVCRFDSILPNFVACERESGVHRSVGIFVHICSVLKPHVVSKH